MTMHLGSDPSELPMSNRRNFLSSPPRWAAHSAFHRCSSCRSAPRRCGRQNEKSNAPAPLNILILGGTGFTGPEQVEYAIARGHRVTLFNRDKTRPGLLQGQSRRGADRRPERRHERAQGKEVRRRASTIRRRCRAWVRNAAQVSRRATSSTTSSSRRRRRIATRASIGIDENSPTTPMPAGLDPYTIDPHGASRRNTTARSRRAPSRRCRSSIRASARSFARA